jgi:hypothetical protein
MLKQIRYVYGALRLELERRLVSALSTLSLVTLTLVSRWLTYVGTEPLPTPSGGPGPNLDASGCVRVRHAGRGVEPGSRCALKPMPSMGAGPARHGWPSLCYPHLAMTELPIPPDRNSSPWRRRLVVAAAIVALGSLVWNQLPKGSYPTDLSRIG